MSEMALPTQGEGYLKGNSRNLFWFLLCCEALSVSKYLIQGYFPVSAFRLLSSVLISIGWIVLLLLFGLNCKNSVLKAALCVVTFTGILNLMQGVLNDYYAICVSNLDFSRINFPTFNLLVATIEVTGCIIWIISLVIITFNKGTGKVLRTASVLFMISKSTGVIYVVVYEVLLQLITQFNDSRVLMQALTAVYSVQKIQIAFEGLAMLFFFAALSFSRQKPEGPVIQSDEIFAER